MASVTLSLAGLIALVQGEGVKNVAEMGTTIRVDGEVRRPSL